MKDQLRPYKKPTIRQVAELAGVSVTTVSHVASGVKGYSPDTVKKVQDAIATLKYTPSYIAKGLRSRATKVLGVCSFDPFTIPETRSRWFAEDLWKGLTLEADERDYSLLSYCSRIRTGEVVEPFLNGFIDGLLIIQLPADPRPAEVASTGMPVVIQMRGREIPEGVGSAYIDEDQNANIILSHLWSLGHRRIAYVGGPNTDDTQFPSDVRTDPIACWRADAYRDWMLERGVYRPNWQCTARRWEPDDISFLLNRLFAGTPRPTAIFCGNDAIALKVIEGAHTVGLRVPDELSVVGVDDLPTPAGRFPALTTLPIPVVEVGRESVRCLLDMIGGAPAESCRRAVPVSGLIVRDSTCPPALS